MNKTKQCLLRTRS